MDVSGGQALFYHLQENISNFLNKGRGLPPLLQQPKELGVDGQNLLHIGKQDRNISLRDQARGPQLHHMDVNDDVEVIHIIHLRIDQLINGLLAAKFVLW